MYKRRLLLGCLLLCGLAPATAPARKTLRVYHVGNSVTDSINYKALAFLAAEQGNQYVYGRHTIPGAPMVGMWDDQKHGFTEPRTGPSQQALKNFEWDAITLQPFDRLLEGDRECDFETASRFIELALAKSPNVQVYIYQRWPKRAIIGKPKWDGTDKCEPIDYLARWNAPYTGKWDNSNETRDYFDQLVTKLNAAFGDRLKHPVKLVPVGEVMAELEQALRDGNVQGMASVNDLYTDHVHLNQTGQLLLGLTFYATLFDADVRSLKALAYKGVDPKVADLIRDCVVKVREKAAQPQ